MDSVEEPRRKRRVKQNSLSRRKRAGERREEWSNRVRRATKRGGGAGRDFGRASHAFGENIAAVQAEGEALCEQSPFNPLVIHYEIKLLDRAET